MNADVSRYRQDHEQAHNRLRAEEQQKCEIADRLDKAHIDLQNLKADHMCLSEYLVRLAHALCWGECSEPPAPGADTRILAETLLERADRLAAEHDHHLNNHEKVQSKKCSTLPMISSVRWFLELIRTFSPFSLSLRSTITYITSWTRIITTIRIVTAVQLICQN